ncbi:serine/threonine-protein kinase [Streptomyces sp. NPDC001941]|uniref:serine/threonine-protein kinase n=1 Tax=Streptomyces sp. NPDC001941 TaxID=3154659 RepID=UPI003322FB12
MDPLTSEDPTHIGPFRLVGRLGSGGMGRVYLARSGGGRAVAVKVVHPQLAQQPEFRHRFGREVAALRRLGGVAGITELLGADTDCEAPWVAIAYVAGPSLSDVVGQEGALPVASVNSLGAGLATALAHIHAHGLVHRDLKPANVLLTVDGPRLIDFGIVRADDTVADLTTTGSVIGSPAFMSPEQVRGERVGPASDVFSLGAVLAYAATGRQPFGESGSGAHSMMFKIVGDEPDLTALPAELDGLVRACLRKDPGARPPADQLAQHLETTDPWLPAPVLARLGRQAEQVLEVDGEESGGGGGAVAETGSVAASESGVTAPASRAGRRRGRVALAVVVALAVLGGGGALASAYWPEGGGGGKERATGVVPERFLGAWEGVTEGVADRPYATARIEISQGALGEKAGVYVQVDGEKLCMGRAALVSASAEKVAFGPGTVESGNRDRCRGTSAQTLTVRSEDLLEWRSGKLTATFKRAAKGSAAVPAQFVGDWTLPPVGAVPEGQRQLWDTRLHIAQGPVGSSLVRVEVTRPQWDELTGKSVDGELLHCTETSVVGAVGGLLVLGPPDVDRNSSDDECQVLDGARYYRFSREGGKDRLLLYAMDLDGGPWQFFRST